MRFVTLEDVAKRFEGRSVAIVGSAPSVLDNKKGFIDSHDIVVRVNNYRTKGFEDKTGERTDVFYSFFGSSIKKTAKELKADGVGLCMCKCPNSKPIESEWHVRNHKPLGIDFRYIYEDIRKDWWFCDTYIPTDERFLNSFELLDRHIPSTGFACILEILSFDCEVTITGFDFFASKVHNVNEPWREGRKDDPIGHSPERELSWLKNNFNRYPIRLDDRLNFLVQG